MGRVVVLFSLTLMIVGVLLTLAGTQHSSTVRLLECFDSLCCYEISDPDAMPAGIIEDGQLLLTEVLATGGDPDVGEGFHRPAIKRAS